MMYKAGDIVISAKQIIDAACGDHPTLLMCNKGDELVVLELFSKEAFPKYGRDSYSVRHANRTEGSFFMDEDELEKAND